MIDWNETVKALAPRLMRFFAGSFDATEAAELVQESLLRLVRLERSGGFDPALGSLTMLAFGIARNVRREALKAARLRAVPAGEASEELADLTDGPETSAAQWQAAARLRQAIAGLGDAEQQVVLLHLDTELTLDEIGAILAMPVGTVKSHMHRAKARLREMLAPTKGVT